MTSNGPSVLHDATKCIIQEVLNASGQPGSNLTLSRTMKCDVCWEYKPSVQKKVNTIASHIVEILLSVRQVLEAMRLRGNSEDEEIDEYAYKKERCDGIYYLLIDEDDDNMWECLRWEQRFLDLM